MPVERGALLVLSRVWVCVVRESLVVRSCFVRASAVLCRARCVESVASAWCVAQKKRSIGTPSFHTHKIVTSAPPAGSDSAWSPSGAIFGVVDSVRVNPLLGPEALGELTAELPCREPSGADRGREGSGLHCLEAVKLSTRATAVTKPPRAVTCHVSVTSRCTPSLSHVTTPRNTFCMLRFRG